jgi:hypothetical protein
MTIPKLSIQEAQEAGLIEHLIYSMPSELLDTQWGVMPYERYLSFEANRIVDAGGERRVAIVQSGALVALYVNPVCNLN